MTTDRWTLAEANAWGKAYAWVCGCNYLPSSAVNFIEMWHADTFDLPTIERELGWAADIGMNSIRINLQYLGWMHDRDGTLDRLDQVMAVASRLGISTVPCLFDDCGFGGVEPVWGTQPDPIPDVHNSRAVASPGRRAVLDQSLRTSLEAYVRDIIHAFRTDDRVFFWDLYNEPGNRMEFHQGGFSTFAADLEPASLSLMRDTFTWARAEAPNQPLTVGAWSAAPLGSGNQSFGTDADRDALALSDIVTFHAYLDKPSVSAIIQNLSAEGRPIFCTEWMARAVNSRYSDQLPLFHKEGVGCYQWGFVKGRTQTNLPWPEALVRAHGGSIDARLWFHDLVWEDGRPYDATEITMIRTTREGRQLRRTTPGRA